MSGVLYFLSLVLGVFALALIYPALLAAAAGDGHAFGFTFTVGIVLFISAALQLALRGRPRQVSRVGSYLLLILSWISLTIFAALPFASEAGLSVLDSLFEALSGITTTGATVVKEIGGLPRSVIFWRAELQWLGGYLTLLSFILILAPAGIGGLPDRHVRLIEHAGRREGAQIRQVAGEIALIYVTVTLACTILLMLTGLPAFDAVCFAFSTVSTGGFVPRDGGIAAYALPASEIVLMVFMLVGATSIIWHRMITQRRRQLLSAHRESYFVIGIALFVGLAIALSAIGRRYATEDIGVLHVIREGMFTGISLVTTTGFDGRVVSFAALPVAFVIFVAAIGGGTFSTAGGLKQYRVGGMCVQAQRDLVRLVYPHGIRPAYFGSQPYDIQLMKAIWSFFAIAILSGIIGTTVIALEPIPFEGAMIASIAALSNIGPLYNTGWQEVIGPVPHYADMAPRTKITLMILMFLGRIEILALFGALNRTYWLRR